MTDVLSPDRRSYLMSRVRGRGNKVTELELLALLRQNKITGWRRHLPLLGKPDFAFPKQKVAVFVDGCLMAFASPQTVPPLWGYLR